MLVTHQLKLVSVMEVLPDDEHKMFKTCRRKEKLN